MTRNEARKLIKSRAPSKYPTSTENLLIKLVDLTYRPKEAGDDDAERPIKTTANALAKAARVGEKQLGRIIEQLVSDGILIDVQRHRNTITCRASYAPLALLADYGHAREEATEKRNADRATAARESEKQKRLYREGLAVSTQTREVLNAALLDYLSKGGTLNTEQQTMLREYRELQKKADEVGRGMK